MHKLVCDLLDSKLSRRGFVAAMVSAGYSTMAARSALASVAPFAAQADAPSPLARVVEGTGGSLLADQLIEAGCRYLFVANGTGLGTLCDALVTRPEIQLIQATHEGQVVAIADGYAKATGKPAFGMFSRVGLMNSSSNLYNAMKDRTPVVLFSDHANTSGEGRDGGEDLDDWIDSVKPYTKWRWVVREATRIPEWTRNAIKIAGVLPSGPTFVRIPRNLLLQPKVRASIFSAETFDIPMKLSADPKAVEQAARLLVEATSPFMVTGFEVTQTGAQPSLVKLAELIGMPVWLARGYGMDFPVAHPLCVGESRGWRYPKKIDCVLNIGSPGFSRMGSVRGASLIHATVDPDAVGRNAPVSVALLGHLDEVAKQLIDAITSMANPSQLKAQAAERRAECAAFTQSARRIRMETSLKAEGSPVPWYRLMAELEALTEPNAVIVPELGDDGRVTNFFNVAPDAKWKIGRTRGQALGWGVGAAAGVKLALPDRQVIAIQGDGGFMFGQTDVLWTLSRYDIPIMVVILNNRSYEATRWRVMARGSAAGAANRDYISYLGDPDIDFRGLAACFNILGATVHNTSELRPAIQKGLRTLKEGRPFLLDVRTRTTGAGAETYWYPTFSLAAQRTRHV